jgi:hypothetical protein
MIRGRSVSIVSGYGLDDRVTEVRSPAEAKDFSYSFCVQTGSAAHPASCPMGTAGPFPGDEARPGRDPDHSPDLVPRSRMSRSYISSPPQAPPWRVVGRLYFCFTISNFTTVKTSNLSQQTFPDPLLKHRNTTKYAHEAMKSTLLCVCY